MDKHSNLAVAAGQGTCTVGVQRQDTGTARWIENAQVSVFMTYSGQHGHTPSTAGIPDEVGFSKCWELASGTITAALHAAVPARWVAADEAYGNSTKPIAGTPGTVSRPSPWPPSPSTMPDGRRSTTPQRARRT